VNWKGEEVLVEIKTTYDNIWNLRLNNNEVPPYQKMQLLIYMYATNHERGFFMTENKNTGELFVLPIRMTDENKAEVERVFEWMHKVKANADAQELLPTRPFTQASKQCKGCGIKNKCWEGFTRGSVNGTDPNPGDITMEPLTLS
jgi:CRISPR/Cas system-associated exonuclease Cas4 (RecB family)